MMHRGRRWTVSEVSTARELAEKLANGRTWTVCSGWFVAGSPEVVFLNDATGPDGGQEYAVVRREADGAYYQIETITMSWCTVDKAETHILYSILQKDFDDGPPPMHVRVEPRIETVEEHRRGGSPMCCA